MRTITSVITAFTLCLISVSTSAFAAPRATKSTIKQCKTFLTLPSGTFVYKTSAPLRNARGALIGYRYEPTLIMNQRFGGGTTTVYDKKGNRIGSCPHASAHGHAGGRWRCTMSTSSLVNAAVKNTKSPTIIFDLKSKGQCAVVPNGRSCYGSRHC